jgi:hypothetical protein
MAADTSGEPQLPVSWYFDPEIFALEKKLLFDAGANYVGHELMVPRPATITPSPGPERLDARTEYREY